MVCELYRNFFKLKKKQEKQSLDFLLLHNSPPPCLLSDSVSYNNFLYLLKQVAFSHLQTKAFQ